MMDTRQLSHLVALAEYLHFGRASRALGMSQPALTKSIQRLEQDLGVKLLDRSRKHVVPTAVGQIVIERARGLIQDATELRREVDLLLGAQTGSLSIGVGPAMSESFLAPAIARVAEKHPAARIALRVDHWKQLSDWLFDGKLDVFVADIAEICRDRRVEITRLPSERIVWFCRREHPLATARRVTREDMLQFPLATPRMPEWAVRWFAEADSRNTSKSQPETYGTVECESYSMLKRMVLASDCISAALFSTVAEEVESGSLVILPVKAPAIKTMAGIVYLRGRTLSPIAKVFIDEVKQRAGLVGS